MVEAGTLCVNADVLKKAGINASSTSTAEAYTNVFIKEAEGKVCGIAHYDFVTNYASLSTIGKEILRNGVSAFAAFMAVEYDPTGLFSNEYYNKLNSLWAMYQDLINRLGDSDYINFIITGTGGHESEA